MNPIECRHGRLARKCEICEYEEEIKELRDKVERLQKDLPILMLLNEYNDIKKAIAIRCADISKSFSHRCDDMGAIIANAIRKEYGL